MLPVQNRNVKISQTSHGKDIVDTNQQLILTAQYRWKQYLYVCVEAKVSLYCLLYKSNTVSTLTRRDLNRELI